MDLADYSRKLLAIAELLHGWAGSLVALDASRREKVACFAEEIAATLAQAGKPPPPWRPIRNTEPPRGPSPASTAASPVISKPSSKC